MLVQARCFDDCAASPTCQLNYFAPVCPCLPSGATMSGLQQQTEGQTYGAVPAVGGALPTGTYVGGDPDPALVALYGPAEYDLPPGTTVTYDADGRATGITVPPPEPAPEPAPGP